MVDFTVYNPPGVYIEEVLEPLQSAIGIDPTTVCLIGPGVGYETDTQQLILTGTTPILLAQTGLDQSSIVVSLPDGTIVANTEYVLAIGTGDDGDLTKVADNTTTIARVSASTVIADGDTVFVTYNYTPPDYTTPTYLPDFDYVKSKYGLPVDLNTGVITSPISLAAQLAFMNGATNIIGVATIGDITNTSFEAAYESLGNRYDANLIVPLPVGLGDSDITTLEEDLVAFTTNSETDGYLRLAILGTETTTTIAPDILAGEIDTRRIMLAYPNKLNYYVGGSANTTIVIGGYYLAAALAGRLAGQAIADGLTRKRVLGFGGFPLNIQNTMDLAQKNRWSNAGVAVVELNRQNQLVCRHGTSTDNSTTITREISITRARDAMINLIKDGVEAVGLIGTPIDTDTPIRVKGVIQGLLETCVLSSVIVGYDSVTVIQLQDFPTVIQVKFSYLPAYPLNYIQIVFSIDVTAGVIVNDDGSIAQGGASTIATTAG